MWKVFSSFLPAKKEIDLLIQLIAFIYFQIVFSKSRQSISRSSYILPLSITPTPSCLTSFHCWWPHNIKKEYFCAIKKVQEFQSHHHYLFEVKICKSLKQTVFSKRAAVRQEDENEWMKWFRWSRQFANTFSLHFHSFVSQLHRKEERFTFFNLLLTLTLSLLHNILLWKDSSLNSWVLFCSLFRLFFNHEKGGD